jgi:hypothetical protein
MARSSYGGNKRRKEIARKKKREAKLARKHNKDGTRPADENESGEDLSYLEYLHPGGVPEELLPDSEEDEEGEETDDAEDDE